MNIVERLKKCYNDLCSYRKDATWKEPIEDNWNPFIFQWSDDGCRLYVRTLNDKKSEAHIAREHVVQLRDWLDNCLDEK
jgi:hypothetical protein